MRSLVCLLLVAIVTTTARGATTEEPQVITSAEGQNQLYSRAGTGTYAFLTQVLRVDQEGMAMNIVYAPDGKTVYLQDIISQDMMDRAEWSHPSAYVKGELSDGKLTIPAGQYVSYDADEQEGVQLVVLKLVQLDDNEDFDWDYVPQEGKDIVFSIDGDRLVLDGDFTPDEATGFPREAIGLVSSTDGHWTGQADYATTYSPINDVPVAAPANELQRETFVIGYEQLNTATGETRRTSGFVQAVVSGSDIWLSSLSDMLPSGWIHGTISDGQATFASRQFMGVGQGRLLYFFGATTERILVPDADDPDDSEWHYVHTQADQLTFTYDASNRTLASGQTLLVNASASSMRPAQAYVAPELKPFVDAPMVPATPGIGTYFSPYDEDGGYMYVSVHIPDTSTEGEQLDTDQLYYRIFLNGQPFTFTADSYPRIQVCGTDELTDVPYSLRDDPNDYTDYCFHDFGGEVLIYFYESGIETVGVQSVYKGGAEERTSDLVTFNTETQEVTITGISSPARTNQQTATIRYYDLAGRPLASPAQGLSVRVATLPDGTRQSCKVAGKR